MTGIAVAGVTASGKSALAVELALRLSGEIISCDSMLVYRGADIGTAKPTEEERRGVPHHLIDIRGADEPFSAGDFVREAERAAREILARGRTPILCGGTGLYLDSFLRGGYPEEKKEVPPELLSSLEEELAGKGAAAMHEKLRALDPEAAERIHQNNTRRVLRAIGLCLANKKTKTELDRLTPQGAAVRDYGVIALRFSSTEARSARIEARTRAMFAAGLPRETEALRRQGFFDRCAAAAQAIGYKELFPYLDGEEGEEEAIARLAAATRRYAKRQQTWYASMPYVRWLSVDEDGRMKQTSQLADEAMRLLFE